MGLGLIPVQKLCVTNLALKKRDSTDISHVASEVPELDLWNTIYCKCNDVVKSNDVERLNVVGLKQDLSQMQCRGALYH